MGELVYSKAIDAEKTAIDCSNLAAGIYTLSVKQGQNVINRKVMIAR